MAENGGRKTTIWWWSKCPKMFIMFWKMLKIGERNFQYLFLLNDDFKLIKIKNSISLLI